LIINQLRFFHSLIFPTFSPQVKKVNLRIKYLLHVMIIIK